MSHSLPLICLCLLTTLPPCVVAQGTKADYDRAGSLSQLCRDKVFRDEVESVWAADGQRLWYRIEIAPGSYEFVIADVTKEARDLAFDHGGLAKQLAEATKMDVNSQRLPFQRLTIVDGENAFEFTDQLTVVRAAQFGDRWLINPRVSVDQMFSVRGKRN